MTYLYTTRAKFDKNNQGEGLTWSKYLEWSRLNHLTELVSVDTGLNEVLIDPDQEDDNYWTEMIFEEGRETGFFRTTEYVLRKTDIPKFNLLAIVIQPGSDCSLIQQDDYDFLGYDLLDHYYTTSALSNCGGFDETFLPGDLNNVGLIDDYEKAYTIQRKLRENNPLEEHADTYVIAIWRHRVIGW
ncbi:hypothetical protein HGH91_13000 [Chitinophaga eiseniae]|uniref:Uncharacterized protein n=2 Tax=Chitinophaga eiseniae TaxID=634771 RepID=A0A847SL80_9BACT|nr:hypothetical protein [Chitinophaga eiseniae]